jgi:hypothetical protein
MTDEIEAEKAVDALDKAKRQIDQIKRLDTEKKLEARESSVRIGRTPDLFHTLSETHKWDLFRALVRKVGLSEVDLEKFLAEDRRLEQKRLTVERAAAADAARLAEKQRLESNRVLFEKVRPYLRIMPRDWEKQYEILESGILHATKDGRCRCGYDYPVDLINCLDVIWASEGKFGWFSKAHHCRSDPKEPYTGVTRMGGSFGIYIDVSAMASAAIDPKHVRWSEGAPAEANRARPLI